ncbi:uncharacterized protein I206_103105 [Kwoniella pini CBS 10737]|uniref:UDP-N-acetylglucosamine transferase subunit ALG13 n=1 Tax=Kwoniella pini CBS 10737 TaxID=1296096 RepID=A0A1B9IAG7_9TREE|nr:uncharacterized protein I206_01891 [Kwoniella pini CBS 10737]OCF52598.1 hypothetical protein I206_01891 [Kwoniella pini CBS 10737]
MTSILITVGSTLFPSLTDKILSSEIISILIENGIEKLIIQYGNANLPFNFKKEINFKNEEKGKGFIKIEEEKLKIELIRFTNDFENLIKNCDFIISHAGSGSILTTLRMIPPKPLLIVPNESLMDNHQSELAEKMKEQGYSEVSSIDDLQVTLPIFLKSRGKKIKSFPQMNRNRFKNILDDLMGFD